MKTTFFNIQGMHCVGCAQTIQLMVDRLDGVQACSVSFGDGAARVLFDPARVHSERIAGAIRKAGYIAVESQA